MTLAFVSQSTAFQIPYQELFHLIPSGCPEAGEAALVTGEEAQDSKEFALGPVRSVQNKT